MKRTALFSALLIVTASVLVAQDWKGKGRQTGFVYDEAGAPLEGVTVKLVWTQSQQGFEVKTGKDGKWTAAWIRFGVWNIDFIKFGYAPKQITITINELSRNPDINVNLTKVEGPMVTEDVKDLLTQGNEFFAQENYDEALTKYMAILEKYPDTYPIYQNVGNCFFAKEDYDKAEENYLKVLEHDATNVDAIIAIGNCYSNRGDTDKASEWYNKLSFEKIDDPIVLYNMGNNHYNSNKFEEALKFYTKANELQKNSPDTLYQLGLTYLNLQKNDLSVAAFEACLKIDPDSPRATQVRAFLDYLKKK